MFHTLFLHFCFFNLPIALKLNQMEKGSLTVFSSKKKSLERGHLSMLVGESAFYKINLPYY